MKRLILSFAIAAFSICSHAQSYNTCKEYVDNYDLPQEMFKLSNKDLSSFWSKRPVYDKKIDRVFTAKSKAAKNALVEYTTITNILKKEVVADTLLDKKYQGLLDKLNSVFSFKKISPALEIHIDKDEAFNAYTYPTGKIFLNVGLIQKLDTMEIIGVVAHEMQHFVGKHSLNRIYATNKNVRDNKLFAEIAGAIAVGAATYAYTANAAYNTMSKSQTDAYFNNVIIASNAFDLDAYTSSKKFRMRYAREQEIEADIAAYRFLQFMGQDPKIYFNVLEKIKSYEKDNKSDNDKDHPSATYRMNVLKVL